MFECLPLGRALVHRKVDEALIEEPITIYGDDTQYEVHAVLVIAVRLDNVAGEYLAIIGAFIACLNGDHASLTDDEGFGIAVDVVDIDDGVLHIHEIGLDHVESDMQVGNIDA